MHQKNPLPIRVDSVAKTGLDKVIEDIQEKFETIEWLTPYHYGRAKTQFLESGARYPAVYAGVENYINAMPNDNLKAMSFFKAASYETTDFDSEQRRGAPMILRRELSLVTWVNLKKINHIESGQDYVYTEVLKDEVYRVLKTCPNVVAIRGYYDESFQEVFEGYDLERALVEYIEVTNTNTRQRSTVKDNIIATNYMMYPFDAFRINFTVKYHESC